MKKHDKTVLTFTKKWVGRLMLFFMTCIASSYVLSYLEKDPLESLSERVMLSGLAVFMGYMLKAFFETYSEENIKLKKMLADKEKAAENSDFDTLESIEDDEDGGEE